ncbi:MAG TPA: TolC family protein [Segetibacter sp.]|jgi:outer membrane protein
MMRCFFTLLSALITIAASAQEKWGLQRCVDYAMQNNISVKQADVQARLSKLTADQSSLTRYPSVNGSLSGSYQRGLNENPTTGTLESADFFSGSMGVQGTYDLFNWGARKNNIAANQLFSRADELNIDRAKNDIALVVANAFLQVMLRREQVKVSQIQVSQSMEQLRTTRKLVNAGSQPELNAINIEAQLARDSSALLQAQALVEQSIINLKAYLNLDMAAPFDIDAPPVDKIPVDNISDLQPEAVYNLALTNQPQQKILGLRIEASQKQVAAARASMYPRVTAFGGLNTRFVNAKRPVIGVFPDKPTGSYVTVNGTQVPVFAPQFGITGYQGIPFTSQLNRNFGQSLGVSVNFNIFNAGSAKANWNRSKLNVTQYQLQDEQERLNLRSNIYNAYQDAYSSLQKYNASVRSVQASQRALDISKKRFDIGLLGTLDYITTQNNLFRARIEEVSNHYDFVFKMKVLEFYKGLGLRL